MEIYNRVNTLDDSDILNHLLFTDNDYNIKGFAEFFALYSRFVKLEQGFDIDEKFFNQIKDLFDIFDNNDLIIKDFNESLIYADIRIIEYILDFLAVEEKDEILAEMIKYLMYEMSNHDNFSHLRDIIDGFIDNKLNNKSDIIFKMLSEYDVEGIFVDAYERMLEKND